MFWCFAFFTAAATAYLNAAEGVSHRAKSVSLQIRAAMKKKQKEARMIFLTAVAITSGAAALTHNAGERGTGIRVSDVSSFLGCSSSS